MSILSKRLSRKQVGELLGVYGLSIQVLESAGFALPFPFWWKWHAEDDEPTISRAQVLETMHEYRDAIERGRAYGMDCLVDSHKRVIPRRGCPVFLPPHHPSRRLEPLEELGLFASHSLRMGRAVGRRMDAIWQAE